MGHRLDADARAVDGDRLVRDARAMIGGPHDLCTPLYNSRTSAPRNFNELRGLESPGG